MRKWTIGPALILTGLGLLPLAAARADVMPMPPVFQRVATADVIVVGRVTGVEDKDVELFFSPQAEQKIPLRIARVAVTEPLKGAKGLKQVRVAFIPNARRGVALKVGQEGIFRLTRHFEGALYLVPMYFDITPASAPNYAQERQQFRRFGKLSDNAATGLKSANAEVRFLTAALRLTEYLTVRLWSTKQQPVSAAESKQLLGALRAADWNKARPPGDPVPLGVFLRLGLTGKDGWVAPPRGPNLTGLQQAAQAWLARHASEYRIRRFVYDAPLKKAP
jgi:hypothetical protein